MVESEDRELFLTLPKAAVCLGMSPQIVMECILDGQLAATTASNGVVLISEIDLSRFSGGW